MLTLRLASRRAAGGPSPDVSVAVPTLDGGRRLLELLASAAQQRGAGRVELLLADSGSTDGSVEAALARYPQLGVLDVPKGRFDHGLVRNALAEVSRARRVAFFTQDAVPLPGCLAALRAALDQPRVAGTWARQVPRPGADPLVTARLHRWCPDRSETRFGPLPAEPRAALAAAAFDNVGSMVRRDVLRDLPFPARDFGEDLAWGARVLGAGWGLSYSAEARVEHHHEPTCRELFDRNRRAHAQAALEFGLIAVPSAVSGGRAWVLGARQDYIDGGLRWVLPGAGRRAAELMGQWAGARAVRRRPHRPAGDRRAQPASRT